MSPDLVTWSGQIGLQIYPHLVFLFLVGYLKFKVCGENPTILSQPKKVIETEKRLITPDTLFHMQNHAELFIQSRGRPMKSIIFKAYTT